MAFEFVGDFLNRVSDKDKAFLARQFAVLLDSGIQISDAMGMLQAQTRSKPVFKAMGQMQKDLENGYSLSEAMKKHPNIFSEMFVNVVVSGESSGKLDTSLALLADEMERDRTFRSKIWGALLYPIFIICAMIVVAIIMTTRIIPSLKDIFDQSGVALPWTTRTVIAVTYSLINYWYVYIIVIIGLGAYLYWQFTSNVGRRRISDIILATPVIGGLMSDMDMARFCRIFAMMNKAGVPIIAALNAVSKVMDVMYYRDIIAEVARSVEKGSPISHTLNKYPKFPTVITEMVGVGEQTGKLEQVLTKMSNYYEGEVEQKLKNVTSLIEPVMFIIVGLGVAFLVFSIIVPIYNISSAIK